MKFIKLLPIISTIILTACSVIKAPLSETRTLDGAEQQQVLEYAGPKAENLISGLIAGDYQTFSADFNQTMKEGMDTAAFDQLLDMFSTKLGSYQSHEVNVVLQGDKFTTVAYKMIFERDDKVIMRIVFDNQEPHNVTGLWFDSPELRKK
jgi:hypothetical protein